VHLREIRDDHLSIRVEAHSHVVQKDEFLPIQQEILLGIFACVKNYSSAGSALPGVRLALHERYSMSSIERVLVVYPDGLQIGLQRYLAVLTNLRGNQSPEGCQIAYVTWPWFGLQKYNVTWPCRALLEPFSLLRKNHVAKVANPTRRARRGPCSTLWARTCGPGWAATATRAGGCTVLQSTARRTLTWRGASKTKHQTLRVRR
jgi:hypothetical protein